MLALNLFMWYPLLQNSLSVSLLEPVMAANSFNLPHFIRNCWVIGCAFVKATKNLKSDVVLAVFSRTTQHQDPPTVEQVPTSTRVETLAMP
jgi:hypothetical protein